MVRNDGRSIDIHSSARLRDLVDGARYLPNVVALGRLYTDKTHRSAVYQRGRDLYVVEPGE